MSDLIRSDKTASRLQQVARLRALGVANHISLPQLVVCGDQSVGKSSVLEGITGLPFPRSDGLCTRFATEILLCHEDSEETTISASVVPHHTRSEESASRFKGFSRTLESFEELPDLIVEVGTLFGIRGFNDIQTGPSFSHDLLHIQVSGPVGLHLSVVDLPGIVGVASEEQDESDVDIVHALVDEYLSNPRTIILAVVQAGNDIANQTVIKKARKFDRHGDRTVGIITKPDLINKGSEKRIALLAKNQDTTKLKLGFFILKNPAPSELEQGVNAEQRQAIEHKFFTSSPWVEQALDRERIGIAKLRIFLQHLLDRHIEQELPKMRKETNKLIQSTMQQLSSQEEERGDAVQQRLYLTRRAMKLHALVSASINGHYNDVDPEFFPRTDSIEITDGHRLRAVAHRLNTEFAQKLRLHGQTRTVEPKAKRRIPILTDVLAWPDEPATSREEKQEDSEYNSSDDGHCTLVVSETEMMQWVRQAYDRNRGKELPGSSNHSLLSELYREQSSQWSDIAETHLQKVFDTVTAFLQCSLDHLFKEESVKRQIDKIVFCNLDHHMEAASVELRGLIQDEGGHPVTYNNHYADDIQKSRQDRINSALQKAVKDATNSDFGGKIHVSNNGLDVHKLVSALQQKVTVDMDRQGCEEALDALDAYYKVSQRTFIDNVCRQVVERHLIRRLPELFNPDRVVQLSDEQLAEIASEPASSVETRRQLKALLASLQECLRVMA